VKQHILIYLLFFSNVCLSCYAVANQTVINLGVSDELSAEIQRLNKSWEQGIEKGDISKVISLYSQNAIYMPEYQPTLNGIEQIQRYFETLASKRTVHDVRLTSEEMHDLNGYTLEIGVFETSISWLIAQNIGKQKYKGKYWRIWRTDDKKGVQVIGEAFGFFKAIENPSLWVTDKTTRKGGALSGFQPSNASIELKAYHALGQKGVKQKNGALRSQLYANDGVFYPYADTAKRGIEVLRPYLIKYSSHGAFIDSVQTHTHDVLYLDNYILEFTKFNVTWTYNETLGQSNGKGIVLRKRGDNGELRIFRHIGTHNFDGE
jgi:ketosteroid isomerase-like protein